MSGRDRFLESQRLYIGDLPIKRERTLDIDDEIESIADQLSMLSDLTYQEAYSAVFEAVMRVYEAHRKL